MRQQPSNHPSYSADCARCGKAFTRKQGKPPKYCSKDCQNASWRENTQRAASAKGNARLDELRAQGRDPRATDQAALKRLMTFRDSALQLSEPDADELADDVLWAERSDYWQGIADPPLGVPSLWDRRPRKSLVLTGHGVRLRIRHGALEVTHGLTHHPQERITQLLFPGDRRMPSRIVLVSASGGVTFDVVEFLARHDIALVVLDYRGRLITTLGGRPGASDVDLGASQLEAVGDGRGFRLSIDLIRAKLGASLDTLAHLEQTNRVRNAHRRVERIRTSLDAQAGDLDRLRLLEAQAANAYFAGWLDVPLRWVGTGRRPIPAEWSRMPLRSSLLGAGNRNSNHPIGSLLNYSYAGLESKVQQAAVALGLDTTIGYLHVYRLRRPALVFDLMEPFRPRVDLALLTFVRGHVFSPGDVFLTDRGICRLHPQLARTAAAFGPADHEVSDEIRRSWFPSLQAAAK